MCGEAKWLWYHKVKSHCASIEDQLQAKIQELGLPVGVRLWRQVAKGNKLPDPDTDEPDYLCKVFVTAFRIDGLNYTAGGRVSDVTINGDRYKVVH